MRVLFYSLVFFGVLSEKGKRALQVQKKIAAALKFNASFRNYLANSLMGMSKINLTV